MDSVTPKGDSVYLCFANVEDIKMLRVQLQVPAQRAPAAAAESRRLCPAPHCSSLPSLFPDTAAPLQPPQAAPGSPGTLGSRFGPLTWQKAAFLTLLQAGSGGQWLRTGPGERWKTAPLPQHPKLAAATCSCGVQPNQQSLKTLLQLQYLFPVSPSGLAHTKCSCRSPLSLQRGTV